MTCGSTTSISALPWEWGLKGTISSTVSTPLLQQGARWPGGLERWTGDRMVLCLNPAAATSLRNFGISVYPALPVSFGGDIKSRRSLLSGVYVRGSKISHQSALEMCNLSWTPHSILETGNSLNHSCFSTLAILPRTISIEVD